MHELESPNEFAGLSAQCHDRVRPFIVSRTLATKEIRAGAAGRNKDKMTFGIDSHDRPGVGCAALPLRIRRFVRRYGIPTPAQFSRAHIKRAHYAAGHVVARVV